MDRKTPTACLVVSLSSTGVLACSLVRAVGNVNEATEVVATLTQPTRSNDLFTPGNRVYVAVSNPGWRKDLNAYTDLCSWMSSNTS